MKLNLNEIAVKKITERLCFPTKLCGELKQVSDAN